jgi:S-layer homology domain
MKRTLAVLGASILCFVGLGVQALAQTPESERTLITDPDLLESMGFPGDATNVYRAKSMDLPVVEEPTDFGLGFHFTALAPKAFAGRESTAAAPWQYNGGVEGCCQNLSRTGAEEFADAQVNLPTGANVAAVRWWANDTNAGADMAVFLFEVCHPGFSAGPTVITARGSASPATAGSGGNQSSVVGGSGGYTVNNQDCRYIARVRFDAVTGLTLQKIRYQWNRQVSPAPAVATFGDVPTGHPFFQFVEAFVASGITAGCGGGNYCPNANLTRGEMAVFFSAALGLYFP